MQETDNNKSQNKENGQILRIALVLTYCRSKKKENTIKKGIQLYQIRPRIKKIHLRIYGIKSYKTEITYLRYVFTQDVYITFSSKFTTRKWHLIPSISHIFFDFLKNDSKDFD